MNILVGENEAGKSTILEAIKIVLNQQYRNAEKTTLHDLFNTKSVDAFKANPSVETLPCILIEIELDLSNYQKDASYFYGEAYGEKAQKQEKFGVRFECSFDKPWDQVLRILYETAIFPTNTIHLHGRHSPTFLTLLSSGLWDL